MIQTLGQWVHDNPDVLLGLLLIAIAFAIALAARVTEVSREIDAVVRRPDRGEPPVDEWAAELDEAS